MTCVTLIKGVASIEIVASNLRGVVVRLADGTTRAIELGDKVEFVDRVHLSTPDCSCAACHEGFDGVIGVLESVGFVREMSVGRTH